MDVHTYKPLLRPATSFDCPKGWRYVSAPHDMPRAWVIPSTFPKSSSWRHGFIAYDRELTRDECRHYALEYVGTFLAECESL